MTRMPRQPLLEEDVQRITSGVDPAQGEPAIVAGRHDQLLNGADLARRRLRVATGTPGESARRAEYDRSRSERDAYLRRVLGQLPFHWHVEHAYATRETANYGGADHIVVERDVQIGRATRRSGDTLARPRRAFNALYAVEAGRLPNSKADIRVAEKIAAGEAQAQAL